MKNCEHTQNKMRTTVSLSFLIVFGTFLITNYVSPLVADEKTERFQFLIDGMKFEREKLVSGIVRGKGERTLTRKVGEQTITNTCPVEYFLAFDFLEGKQRVDRHEPRFKENDSFDLCLGQYIETNDAIMYCSSVQGDIGTGIIFVARPKEGDYDFRNKNYCHPLDIRNIGLLDLWRFTHGDTRSFDTRISEHKQRIPDVLVEEENGIVRYEYHQRVEEQKELMRRSVLWMDTKNGFTLRRTSSNWEFDSRKDQPWDTCEDRISWKKIDGVWVPTEIVFENNLSVGEKERFVMAFDWQSINKPVDREYFTYCDFDPPCEHTPVASVPLNSGGGVDGHLGDYINNCGTKEGRLLMKQLEVNKSSRLFWYRTLAIVGVILIVIGLFLRFIKFTRL